MKVAANLLLALASLAAGVCLCEAILRLFHPVLRSARPEDGHQSRTNLDFDFGERGARFDGKCVAVVPLPEAAPSSALPIVRLRTGQFSSAGEIWAVEWLNKA